MATPMLVGIGAAAAAAVLVLFLLWRWLRSAGPTSEFARNEAVRRQQRLQQESGWGACKPQGGSSPQPPLNPPHAAGKHPPDPLRGEDGDVEAGSAAHVPHGCGGVQPPAPPTVTGVPVMVTPEEAERLRLHQELDRRLEHERAKRMSADLDIAARMQGQPARSGGRPKPGSGGARGGASGPGAIAEYLDSERSTPRAAGEGGGSARGGNDGSAGVAGVAGDPLLDVLAGLAPVAPAAPAAPIADATANATAARRAARKAPAAREHGGHGDRRRGSRPEDDEDHFDERSPRRERSGRRRKGGGREGGGGRGRRERADQEDRRGIEEEAGGSRDGGGSRDRGGGGGQQQQGQRDRASVSPEDRRHHRRIAAEMSEKREKRKHRKKEEAAQHVDGWAQAHGSIYEQLASLPQIGPPIFPEAWTAGDVPRGDAKKLKRAYHRAAARVHPDKVHDLPVSAQALAEELFKALGEAYQKEVKRIAAAGGGLDA